MKIALVQAPIWWTVDAPLGLAQIAGCMSHAGHEVSIFDLNILLAKTLSKECESLWNWEQFHFWNNPEMVARFYRDNAAFFEKQLEILLQADARLIGFSVYAGSQLASLEFARRIKAADPSRTIVFGGQYFHLGEKAREILQDPAVDAVVCGSGDISFPALAALLEEKGALEPMPGIMVRMGDEIVSGGPEPEIKNLDDIPFSDFTGFPLELYDVHERLPIHGSRGCVWKCHFCSSTAFWSGYRYMSGDRLFAELMHQKSLFPQKNHFEFYDITANGDVRALERLCELIIEKWKVNQKDNFFGWKINAVLRPDMTRTVLDKLSAANCHDIIYGVESGSERLRKIMNKPFDNETAERVLKDTHDAGIKTVGNFMFGFPGETEEDFQLTLDFLERNRASFDRVYASATFTSLEEHSYLTEHRKELGIRENPSGELHHLYWETEDGKNTYPVRQDRYERFRKLAISLGIDAYKGVNGTVEQDKRSNLAQFHRHEGDHLKAISHLFEYLELDLYNEPMRKELSHYRDDLSLLGTGLKAVEKANRLLQGEGGLSANQLLEIAMAFHPNGGGLPEMPENADSGEAAKRWLFRARGKFLKMRDRAEMSVRDGRIEVEWCRSAGFPLEQVSADHKRAKMILELADSEIRSGVSQQEVPVCGR